MTDNMTMTNFTIQGPNDILYSFYETIQNTELQRDTDKSCCAAINVQNLDEIKPTKYRFYQGDLQVYVSVLSYPKISNWYSVYQEQLLHPMLTYLKSNKSLRVTGSITKARKRASNTYC